MYFFRDEEVFLSQLFINLLVNKTIHNHSFLKNCTDEMSYFIRD
jgi:hypothetical protein